MSARAATVLVWLMHAYLMAFPLLFMAVFTGVGLMVSHGHVGALLADIAMSLLVLVLLALGLFFLARWISRGIGRGRGIAVFLGWMEAALGLGVAAWLLAMGQPMSIGLGILGLLVIAGAGVALARGPRRSDETTP